MKRIGSRGAAVGFAVALYKAEIWSEDGKLKVRGYLGPFYKTQTWLKGR